MVSKVTSILCSVIMVSSCAHKNTPVISLQNRTSASENEDTFKKDFLLEDVYVKHVQTFTNLMNAPSNGERSRQFAQFIDRQRSFYYIAQDYIQKFDTELDVLHQKKLRGEELTSEEIERFAKIRLQNLIAWEFSERNLHEITHLYEMAALNTLNTNSPYHVPSSWIVANVPKWLNDGVKKGEAPANINLARHFEDVNTRLKELPNTDLTNFKKLPNLKKFATLPTFNLGNYNSTSSSFTQFTKKNKTSFDRLVETQWTKYLLNRTAEISDSDLKDVFEQGLRKPQALDVLEPDSGGKGHVTGSRFPAGKWAITFDDGPHSSYTKAIQDSFDSENTPVTFFWQAQNIIQYPQISKSIKGTKHNVALHSYTHANLPKLNQAGLDKEINQAVNVFEKALGEKPTMFRCPYGACGPMGSSIRQMIAQQNMLHIFWNVDTLDWQDKNAESIFQRAKKQVDVLGRGIVLFHDIHSQSVVASKKLVQYMKTKYKIEPLNQLIGESRGKPYYSP